MTEPISGGDPGSTSAGACPWCSTPVAPDAETCPSCGAAMRERSEGPAIPGLTQVDASLALRREAPKPNRLVGWLAGDVDTGPAPSPTVASASLESALGPAGAASVAPPSEAVRREMARLELEAIKAELELRGRQAAPPDDGPTATAAAAPPASPTEPVAAEPVAPEPGTAEPPEQAPTGDGPNA
ncbi:MAG TPA: zinc ribbon domain-containing protein [Candidatus Limnocylindrales bacterium]|nr:zinc ribbon domain-containing protein [Candidatus Limnocylindrales bacterium]